MYDPYAITVCCDGAMDYDKNQTGGNGFFIEFPESVGLDSVSKSFRNDRQGIYRLEILSILEAMEELIAIDKRLPITISKASGVKIYTDRFSVTDETQLNRFNIARYRKNDWKNDEGKPIKNRDLIERVDKTRTKLETVIKGRVEIFYHREKKNKVADKLSKLGKKTIARGKVIAKKKKLNVSPRMFDGPEIDHALLHPGDYLNINVYKWELVDDQYEIGLEIIDGRYKGMTMKIYVDRQLKNFLHRQHQYSIQIERSYRHHAAISKAEEIDKDKTTS